MPNSLANRRQALEDRFFQDQEAEQVSRMREKLAAQKNREELAAVCGIEDATVLDTLTKLAVGAHDVSALTLVPLVQVAWADGNVTAKEREAVLKAAVAQGIADASHSHALLDAWLDKAPGEGLFQAWTSYVEALRSHIDVSEMTALKESILGLAHDVADAAGGYLGIGSVSGAEKKVLAAIGAAFDG
ncbi:MAG: hypothetical protein GY811_07730 [Myxococcales bacterium]|nr:hypothetical protein [Myxococcales bacterium]